MTSRCQQESNVEYWRYGGSGIKICNKWQKFDGFLDDMGKSPDGGTLDRIDGTKGYNKANCRWATTLQQAVNRRGNLNSTSKYKGVYMPTNRKNWCARIQSKDKAFNLGTFTDEKEAALAYNKAAYDLWGKDAYLNKFD